MIKTKNQHVSEKEICRQIKEQNLSVFKIKKRKYSSYLGEMSLAVELGLIGTFVQRIPMENGLLRSDSYKYRKAKRPDVPTIPLVTTEITRIYSMVINLNDSRSLHISRCKAGRNDQSNGLDN